LRARQPMAIVQHEQGCLLGRDLHGHDDLFPAYGASQALCGQPNRGPQLGLASGAWERDSAGHFTDLLSEAQPRSWTGWAILTACFAKCCGFFPVRKGDSCSHEAGNGSLSCRAAIPRDGIARRPIQEVIRRERFGIYLDGGQGVKMNDYSLMAGPRRARGRPS